MEGTLLGIEIQTRSLQWYHDLSYTKRTAHSEPLDPSTPKNHIHLYL